MLPLLRDKEISLSDVTRECPLNGRTLLHMAVMRGEVEVVRKLMCGKFSDGEKMVHLDLNVTDVWGDTPLVLAASRGHVGVREGVRLGSF